jgi:hypothetical protein
VVLPEESSRTGCQVRNVSRKRTRQPKLHPRSVDSISFGDLTEGIIQLMVERLGEAKALELIKANFTQ